MRSKHMTWLIGAVILYAPVGHAQTQRDWPGVYRSDLAFTYATIKREHPADAPPRDEGFYRRLEISLAAARRVVPHSYAEYAYSLSRFVAGLRDQHSLFMIDSERAGESWPGFMVGRRDGAIVVVDRDSADAPPLGARLVACDRRSAEQLATQSLPGMLHPGSPTTPKWRATYIFIKADPLYRAPTQCRFAYAGITRTYEIKYTTLGTNASRLFPSAFGAPPPIGVSEVAPDVFWVGLPTFSESDKTRSELSGVVEYLKKNRERMRTAKAVVFDVRGNGGGYFTWGKQVLSALFGEEDAKSLDPKDEAVNYWRASPEHVSHLREVAANVAKISSNSEDAKGWTDLANNVERASKAGQPFFRDADRPPGIGGGLPNRRPAGKGPFPAKLVFLADGMCASACLMFADRLLAVPGVTHIGGPTNADGVYTQIRTIKMPSGEGTLQLSQVAIRGGARGDMERYDPDIPYSGADWSTGALTAWALRLLTDGKLTGPRPSRDARPDR